MTGPVLETARLVLRVPIGADLEGWAAFMADPEASRFIGGPLPRAAAWRGMATMTGSWVLHGFGMFSVIERESGAWIGRLGAWMPPDWPGPEIGWGLARAAWGKGYALEGAIAVLDWTFDVLGWTEVIHCIDRDNAPSRALARKLGSVNRGPGQMPPPYENERVEIWGQTAAQWRDARQGAV